MTNEELEKTEKRIENAYRLRSEIQRLKTIKKDIANLTDSPLIGFCYGGDFTDYTYYYFKHNVELTREVILTHIDFQIAYYESEFERL